MVYLLHLNTPLGHAKHYLGFATNLKARLTHHEKGTGARLLQVAMERGITWSLVRTWTGDEGTRTYERRLKRRKNSPKLCPICRKEFEHE